MEVLKIMLPLSLGLFVGIILSWKGGSWGIGIYQVWLFFAFCLIGILIVELNR